MDGHYPDVPPLGAFHANDQPVMLPKAYPPGMHGLQAMLNDSLNSYSDYDSLSRVMVRAQPRNVQQYKSRRQQLGGSDSGKHRRTRSGCYTCRSRRVKCGEEHPVCERCRKGKRECQYPDTSVPSKPSRSNLKAKGSSSGQESGSNSSGEDEEDEKRSSPPSFPDDEEEHGVQEESNLRPGIYDAPRASDTASLVTDGTKSPFADASASVPSPPRRSQPSLKTSKQTMRMNMKQSTRWATLSSDVQKYLLYHRNHLTHHHYGWKYDSGDFLKTTFLEIAMADEALLYAVTGFAAYHYTLTLPDGNVNCFLRYYNRSVQLLLESLRQKKKHTVGTLLNILQLATFEEFLGDWVNLLGHQKAAYEIITELFSPETIMQSETHRKIISWYIRFELFAGLMSGNETVLTRDWFAACTDFYKRQARDNPSDLGSSFEDHFATSCLLTTDVTLLFAAKTKGSISDQEFADGCSKLAIRVGEVKNRIKNSSNDPHDFVKSFPNAPPTSERDLFDVHDPLTLYGDELWTMNFVLIDSWAMELMFKLQLSLVQRRPPGDEMPVLAYKMCKMIEQMECCEHASPASLLGTRASLAIASLFLPKDEPHIDWARRKFASVEQQGYVYPATFRARMSELWGRNVSQWWLPNDEAFPPIIQSIRDFIEHREYNQIDSHDEGVRDIKGLFENLRFDDSESNSDMIDLSRDSTHFEPLHGDSMYTRAA